MGIKAGKIIEIPAGEAKNIDFSSAYGEIVEGDGATATASRINSLEETAHGDEDIIVTSPEAIDGAWPFIRVSSAGGITYVSLNWK